MSLFEVGALILLASVVVSWAGNLFVYTDHRGWYVIDGAAAIGVFLMLIGGARVIIEWWPA